MSYVLPPLSPVTDTPSDAESPGLEPQRSSNRTTNRAPNDRRIPPSDDRFTPRQPTERTPAPEAGPDATGTRPTPMQSYLRWALLLGLPLVLSLLNDRDDS